MTTTKMLRAAALGFAGSLIFAATPMAFAGTSCSAESFNALKKAILSQNQVSGVQVAPTTVYNGLTSTQTEALSSSSAEAQYNQSVWMKMASATKSFIETDGNAEAAASKLFGASNRRQLVEIYKRADASTPASVTTSCGAGSCQDIALEATTMHSIPGKTAKAVMDDFSARKLSSVKPGVVVFCETGSGCTSKNQLVAGSGKARQATAGPAMKPGVMYTAREIATSMIGTIDNTSLYQVTPLEICGHAAYLMNGIATRDANSFLSSSSDSLVVEAGSRVLTLTLAQGIAVKGSSVQGIFLHSMFGGTARGTLVKGYNEGSQRLGTNETIDKNGFLE